MKGFFTWDSFSVFSVLGTTTIYALARATHGRAPVAVRRSIPPLVLGVVFLAIAIKIGRVDMVHYNDATKILVWCLAPATVSLAIPLMQSPGLWRKIKAIGAAVTIGVMANIAWTILVCHLFKVAPVLEASLRPKTSTAAIALQIASRSGGLAAMAAAFSVLCGVLGSWFYPLLWPHAENPEALGIAVGSMSHGIGTSRLASEKTTVDNGATAASAFAMALAGLITGVLLLPWMIGR